MVGYRSAILTLIACILLGAPTRASQSAEFPADPIRPLISGHSSSSIVWCNSPRLPHGATFARFNAWKTRLKSVLKETNQKIIQECQFGPAILPDRLPSLVSADLFSCPSPTRPPLRC